VASPEEAGALAADIALAFQAGYDDMLERSLREGLSPEAAVVRAREAGRAGVSARFGV
jgi:hypothetical protein